MRYILISLLLIMPMKVIAEKYDGDATLRNSGPVYISITDNANGGCWTNIKEVRDYVIGQVEARGGKTVPSLEDIFGKGVIVEVTVHAERHPQLQACIGNVSVDITTPSSARHDNNLWGYLHVSKYSSLGFEPKNFNIYVLDIVQKAFKEW